MTLHNENQTMRIQTFVGTSHTENRLPTVTALSRETWVATSRPSQPRRSPTPVVGKDHRRRA
jgi:hypothetical protein